MAFSFSKLFSKTSTSAQTDDTIEAIIEAVENKPYGVSEQNVLFAGLNELGGYFFFQTVIVGNLKVKSKNGAQLSFKGEGFDLKLDADILEFESTHTEVKGRFVTNIDFQIEKSDIKKLEKLKLKSINLTVKKQDISFKKYSTN